MLLTARWSHGILKIEVELSTPESLEIEVR